MNKRWSNIITFILIMVLLGYIILDRITKKETGQVILQFRKLKQKKINGSLQMFLILVKAA